MKINYLLLTKLSILLFTYNRIKLVFAILCLFLKFNLYSQDYKFSKSDADAKDLAYYKVVVNTGFEYKVYFDVKNETAAFQAIPHLNKTYKEILKVFKAKENSPKFADVVIVSNKDYKLPVLGNKKWKIQNDDSASLSIKAKDEIYSLMSHEQVHALQNQFGNCNKLPRWFEEGQAMWIEGKTLSYLTPKKWNIRLNNFKQIKEDEESKNKKTTALENWKGVGFSIEAIKKQLTPEGIKYLEKHGVTPPGVTLSFKPSDFKEENHDILSHASKYFKSYMVFNLIEDKIGIKEFIKWNSHVLNKCYSSNEIVNSLKEEYNLDINKELKK